MKPAIDIVIPACKDDVLATCACLKTLEVNPPTIDFKIHLLAHEQDLLQIQSLVVESAALNVVPYVGSMAQAVNTILLGTERPYSMFIHSDCLFIHEQWCDMLLSMIIQKDLGAISTQPFDQIELPAARGTAQCFRGDIVVLQSHMVRECGGVPSDVPDYGIALGLQARMVKMHIPFGGSDLSKFIAHMGKCRLDKMRIQPEARQAAGRAFEREYTAKSV